MTACGLLRIGRQLQYKEPAALQCEHPEPFSKLCAPGEDWTGTAQGMVPHHSSAGVQQRLCLAVKPECKAIGMLNVRKLQSPASSSMCSDAVVYILLIGTSLLQGIVSSCRDTWKSPAMPGHTVETSGFRA